MNNENLIPLYDKDQFYRYVTDTPLHFEIFCKSIIYPVTDSLMRKNENISLLFLKNEVRYAKVISKW